MVDSDLLKHDSSDMLSKVAGLPEQLRLGMELAREAWKPLAGIRPDNLVIAGMGGSAIGAEILKSLVVDRLPVPIDICRDYRLPRFVGEASLVICSSYSGNTREALACFDAALDSGARLACVCSGGELLSRAREHSVPYLELPGGYPPRAAVGYSFAALLGLVVHTGMVEYGVDELAECSETMEGLCGTYSSAEAGRNAAFLIARSLLERVPVVYCGNRLAAVALRWKNQFCENSKKPAFVGILPEMTHNDIMGWEVDHVGIEPGVIFLRSSLEHPGVASRFPFLRDVVGKTGGFCGEFWGTGAGLLTQVFSLVLLGDYASVYLALLRGLDPTPIATIDEMKSSMKKGNLEA
jgi:glucose/mannose-6-phosphate isomerase